MAQTCPRRMQDFGPWDRQEGLDNWREDARCSFCGSLNPDVLMQRLEAGDVELGPTDKSYKVYVRNSGGAPFLQTYRDCPRGSAPHMAEECTHWVTREVSETKFYFQHLSADQQRRFIELLNARKVKFGYPGHFYVLPFFCRSGVREAAR